MEELLQKLERKSSSHKGQNGKVGVIGGSKDFTGAPALTAEASLRTGTDLPRLLVPESVKDIIASYSENLIVDSYSGDYFGSDSLERARHMDEWADATVIGPGLGSPDREAVKDFVEDAETPLVIDADAIKPALEADVSSAVFTPHSGEAEAIEEEFGSIQNFVEEKVVVVVKGETDRIYTPGEVFENETGHPGMTVGGTGDVLTGVIAGLVAQGLELQEAARLGTWLNGKAGEKAAEEYGNGLVATDIIEEIPELLD